MRSSISPPRMARADVAPMDQRSASSRLDLPQPFGPTMPVRPSSIGTSTGSTKDLKPAILRPIRCKPGSCLALQNPGFWRLYGEQRAGSMAVASGAMIGCAARYCGAGVGGFASSASMAAERASIVCSTSSPPMRKVGVEVTKAGDSCTYLRVTSISALSSMQVPT